MDSHRAAIRDPRQEFGRRQLLDITQEDIDRWFSTAKTTLSPYRFRRATMMLRRIFHQAVTDDLDNGQPILSANRAR